MEGTPQEPAVEPQEPAVEAQGPAPAAEGERRPRIRSETLRRLLWVIPWIAFAITIIVMGGVVFMASMIGLAYIGLREFFQMTAPARPLLAPAYVAAAGMIIAANYGDQYQLLLVFAALFPATWAFAAARRERPAITFSIAITVMGVAWIGTAFAHAMLLRDLPDHGGALLIDVLVATFVGDTAAYAGGRMFGSRRIAPRLSPNKTLEGLIAGFIGATMGFWFAGLYQDWLAGTEALIMGACLAAVAPVGDLFSSMIKRDRDIKDTGRIFGPHGGLIDRLDAVLFTVVAGYYLSVAFVY